MTGARKAEECESSELAWVRVRWASQLTLVSYVIHNVINVT